MFDRDEHANYNDALTEAARLDEKFKNDLGKKVAFLAVPSVPCFELWLLLHYRDIGHIISRGEVYDELHRHWPEFRKGQGKHFAATRSRLTEALDRSARLAAKHNPHQGSTPYTGVGNLVRELVTR